MQTRSVPFWISAFIHGVVFGVAGFLFIRPPEFAIDSGRNSVEVNLVAAAPDPVQPPPTPDPETPALEQPPKPDDLVVPVKPPEPVTPPVETPPAPTPPPPVVQKPKTHRAPTVAKGDGSAPKPGKDATTLQSVGGAIMDSKPDYLSNPPPDYPESSRMAKEQGVVLLQVIVNENGRPDTVTILTTSGFSRLDESAIDAVRDWRFRPATLGTLKVKSRIHVPVRFRLDE